MTDKMKETTISNSELSIKVKAHGAELSSIIYNGKEYLWQADPAFWSRHSPVLFPIVGAVWDGIYKVEGEEYSLSQHGFARDMEFGLLSAADNEIWYRLCSNDDSKKKYPYDFQLNIGYKLEGRKIHVMWEVHNPSESNMYFQIGAHPAFYLSGEEKDGNKGFFGFDNTDNLQITLIKKKGCADTSKHYNAELNADRLMPITADTFTKDALIFENHQLKDVTLYDSMKNPYLNVSFDAPLVGLWAPKPTSPFVCIEPWYGRCDSANYNGEFKDKEWIQTLSAKETFKGGYTIEIL